MEKVIFFYAQKREREGGGGVVMTNKMSTKCLFWGELSLYWNSSLKNENSVIMYSPSSSKWTLWPVRISLFCRTERKMFWRKFVTRLFWGTVDFHCRKKYYGNQWCPRTSLFPTFFRISSFVFSRHDDRIFIFGWTIPLMAVNIIFRVAVFKRKPRVLIEIINTIGQLNYKWFSVKCFWHFDSVVLQYLCNRFNNGYVMHNSILKSIFVLPHGAIDIIGHKYN